LGKSVNRFFDTLIMRQGGCSLNKGSGAIVGICFLLLVLLLFRLLWHPMEAGGRDGIKYRYNWAARNLYLPEYRTTGTVWYEAFTYGEPPSGLSY